MQTNMLTRNRVVALTGLMDLAVLSFPLLSATFFLNTDVAFFNLTDANIEAILASVYSPDVIPTSSPVFLR